MRENTKTPVVLVVENQPQNSGFCFGVLTAHNGAAAEQIFASRPNIIDLLITDVEMPEMDGIALAQRLKTRI